MVKTPVRLTDYALYQRPDCLVLLTTGGGGNLLAGADFESGSGWNERPDPQHPATAFYRGGELVKPRDNGQTNENVYVISNLADGVLQSVKLPVTGSTLYHLSAWLRGEIGAGGSPETGRWEVRVRFFDANENEIIEGTVTAASGGAGSLNIDWRQEGELFMTPSGAVEASVELVSHLTSGWVAFDDVAFVRQLSTEKYYYAGTQRVAMDDDGQVFYLLGDHLGSTSVMVPSVGGPNRTRLYKPWGELRYSEGASPTDYLYTGQQWHEDIGLYNYGARWYDSTLGRFAQADTIVPDPGNTLGFDRYAYANNSPIRYIDPSGHEPGSWWDFVLGAAYEYANDVSLGAVDSVANSLNVCMDCNASASYQQGQNAGQAMAIIQGTYEQIMGTAAVVGAATAIPATLGGGAACALATGGVCAIPAGAAVVVEGAAVVGGATTYAHGSAVVAFAKSRPLQGHHPWPQYLLGPKQQELYGLSPEMHTEYHNQLDGYLSRKLGKGYYKEAINSPEKLGTVLENLREFNKYFDETYGTHTYEALEDVLRNEDLLPKP